MKTLIATLEDPDYEIKADELYEMSELARDYSEYLAETSGRIIRLATARGLYGPDGWVHMQAEVAA
jgi:hypothetical protein